MIYITGDTHGSIDFDKIKMFVEECTNLTPTDYLIIAGDFGAIWNPLTLSNDLKKYECLPCTVLFIDGNHENFDLLNSYEKELWNGGKVHKISSNILHLMRGQVFEIDGLKFFTFGGAESIDKVYRHVGISWWAEEVPNKEEFDEAMHNLEKVNFTVDYIITHTIDEKTLKNPVFNDYKFTIYPTSRHFNYFEENVKYKHWFFGHFHEDININENKTLLYNKIIKIK
jgi:DNA repair exonuclease SbcCD nuclease subunit